MKVIVSHDVDHLFNSDHFNDLIIPKYLIRSSFEFLKGSINYKEYFFKLANVFQKKWNGVEDIMLFDKSQGIPSSFYFGMASALGMNYKYTDAIPLIKKVISEGFDCGVHGVCFDNEPLVLEEFNIFKKVSGSDKFGIRMHYLRSNEDTLNLLSNAGYLYDSTIYSENNPFRVGDMWEFPLHIMDVYEFSSSKLSRKTKTEDVIASTIKRINSLEKKGIKYLTLLMHDRNFLKGQGQYKLWYEEVIFYLKDKYEFISYPDAIQELNSVP